MTKSNHHTFTTIQFRPFRFLAALLFLVAMTIFPVAAQQTFYSSGTYNVPLGVALLKVEAWGAGGGGSTITYNGYRGGGGGGGGAFASSVITVTTSSYNITVGTGGAGGVDGGNSTFDGSVVVAVGGGGATNESSTAGAGGTAAASTGTIKWSGGNGANGLTYSYSGGGGGGAGSNASGQSSTNRIGGTGGSLNGGDGADGRTNSEGNGTSGSVYGGGGSGAYTRDRTNHTGGSGANGLVIITPCLVEVFATFGVNHDYYATVGDAITAINNGIHQGSITVELLASTTESSAISLNASGSGSASYSNVRIFPTTTGLSISGSVNGPLFSFNGSQNAAIDGRVNATGSTTSLTITNTNTGTSASTIQFNNSAQSDTLLYCQITGGNGSTTNGTILFGTTGTNSTNTISNCQITNNGNRRVNALYAASGTNTGNTVTNNAFYDNWLTTASSYSINLGSNTSAWTITGNSFYQTDVASLSGTSNYYAVYINNTSGTNFNISNNYIGGSTVQCGGSSMSMGTSTAGSTTYYPIYLNVGTSVASTVQGNFIQNIDYSSTNTTPFAAIVVAAGAVTVNANTVGDPDGLKPISITARTTNTTSYGIYLSSTGTLAITNNTLSSLVLAGSTSTFTHNFSGIYKNSSSGSTTISGNVIGHATTSGSISIGSTAAFSAQTLYGINVAGTGTNTISSNTIANLINSTTNTNAATTGTVTGIFSSAGLNTISSNTVHDLSIANGNTTVPTLSVCGLMLTSTTAGKTVSGNTIYNLSNTYSTAAAVNVAGIYYAGATYGTNVVEKSLIYGLSAISTSANVCGLYISSGSTTYSNNIISLSNDQNNAIFGTIDAGATSSTCNFYHNTIYLGGTASANASSYAFYSSTATNTRNYRNNIFFNARSSGGSNYAIYYAATGTWNLTVDYNDYKVTGTNGILGYYPSSNCTLETLRTATGGDANSVELDPGFQVEGGLLAVDYKTSINLIGTSSGITIDYGGGTRYSYTMGAWEFQPVEVWKNNIKQATYGNLKSAIDKINDGTWTGDLTIKITGSTVETASVVLNASGSGSANYTHLLIYPEASDISVTGNVNAPLLSLNGADYVTINGSVYLNNTTPGLTLVNTSTGSSASTLEFSESAQNNTIKYCYLKGNPASATQGVVLFSTSSVGTGNSADTIVNCMIAGTGSTTNTRPYNALYSVGSSGAMNSGIQILDNQFYDFFNPGIASNGILLGSYSTAFTISGNSFYESASFASSAAVAYNAISIDNTSGGGFVVSDNFIGGSAASCVGTFTKTGNNNLFNGILLNVGNVSPTSIQGNIIKGFNYTNTANTDWIGINVASGRVDVGTIAGNTLGESAGTGSITISNGASGGNFYGMYFAGTDTIDCENNLLGSINIGTSNTTWAASFYGIYKSSGGGTLNIVNNVVGGTTTENSLIASSLSTGNIQLVNGIYSAGTGNILIQANEVSNLVNATTATNLSLTRGIMTVAGSNTIDDNIVHHISTLNAQGNNYNNCSLIGIEQISEQAGSLQLIRGNKVYSLKNTTLATIEMYGIFFRGPATGANEISRNFVNTFIVISTDAAYLHGISLHTGAYTCSNNIVFLGDTITTGCHIWCIWNYSNSEVHIYHNTAYLSGIATTGTSNSFAFRDISTNPSNRTIENNILWNGRTNTTVISHYSIHIQNTQNSTIDYNDYQFAENFGTTGGGTYANLAAWQAATGFDAHSLNVDPELTNLGGILPSDYQTGVALSGTPISGQTLDFGYSDRSLTAPTMGAWEYVANPVEIWNGATFRSDYPRLKQAFDAINAGTWTGDLTIKIKSNVRETVKAVLYQSGYTGGGGTSSYTRVHIYPTRTGIQVYGKLPTPLIELNGAHGVVFDGRVDGTGASYNMTLQNDSISTSASTLIFLNSAEVDTVKYCNIKGLSTNPSGGIIHFSTSTGSNGNNNNVIISNKITTVDSNPSVKSRVINAIYSEGTSGKENTGNSIRDNEIFDVWSQGASSYGIRITSNSTGFTISGNSLYETTTFTPSGAYTYNGIHINNTSGNGYIVTSNYIGGKAIQCQGSALLIGTTTPAHTFALQPIYLNVGAGSATSLQGNTIKNYQLTSPNTSPFTGLYIDGGEVNVGTTTANSIGENTGTGSINLIGVAATSSSYGIYVNSTAAVNLTNNTIGSITTNVTGSTAYGHTFYGIYKAAVAGSFIVSGNAIGSQTATSSINTASISTGNSQSVYGIYTLGSDATTIYNNVLANITNSTTRSNSSNNIEAVYFGGSSSSLSTIQNNFVYGLSHASTATSGANRMIGIHLASGKVNASNNILWIGDASSGRFNYYGFYEDGVTGQNDSVYHNSVYLSGTTSSTISSTYAYYKAANVGTSNIRNNIFYNTRTGGFTGKHYAIYLPGTTTMTINANDYICSGGSFLGYLGGDRTSLATWKTATGQDVASLNTTPFTAPASALAINFRPMLDLAGVSSGTAYDYGLNPRNSTTPTIGAWERVNKWKGSISIDFNNASNWTFNMVPAAYDNIIFDDAPNRPCTIAQDRFVTDIVNNQATYRFIVNGYKLTIRGNLTFANGAQIDASATGSTLEFDGTAAQSIPSGSLYNDRVYNLTINNTNNVTLYGTLVLLNTLTATTGKLNASSTGTTVTYAGTAAQTIESNRFLNEKVYNLNINNLAGVTVNALFTADHDMSILSGASLIIPETKGLTVSGLTTNNAGTSGLLLKSSALGTASLIQATNSVPATVQRYIDGDSLAWHFLSSPVSNQAISGTWKPTGTYGDGTGYDLYLWDEPHSCWVYNLNADSIPAWTVANPGTNFVTGRGYIYAIQDSAATKQFAGNLNGGTIARSLTIGGTGSYQGFNLLGNPYPSSMDWSLAGGFDRSMLYLNGSGYDIWTWSTTANNYGVYNSADADGTNNVNRYIAPMQAFFVRASTAGTFNFKNASRVHNGASVWLKSAQLYNEEHNISMTVSSTGGSDEVRFGFGYPVNEGGAMKLFSPVLTAPSLYMNYSGLSFTTRRLTDTISNKYVSVNFKAGETATYTLNCSYDVSTMGTLFLEDRQTGSIIDLSAGEPYTFQATPADAPERFVVHVGTVIPVDQKVHPNIWVSAGVLNVYLENMVGDYTMRISDLQGRLVERKKMSGGEQCSVSLFGHGFYLVTVENSGNRHTTKVLY